MEFLLSVTCEKSDLPLPRKGSASSKKSNVLKRLWRDITRFVNRLKRGLDRRIILRVACLRGEEDDDDMACLVDHHCRQNCPPESGESQTIHFAMEAMCDTVTWQVCDSTEDVQEQCVLLSPLHFATPCVEPVVSMRNADVFECVQVTCVERVVEEVVECAVMPSDVVKWNSVENDVHARRLVGALEDISSTPQAFPFAQQKTDIFSWAEARNEDCTHLSTCFPEDDEEIANSPSFNRVRNDDDEVNDFDSGIYSISGSSSADLTSTASNSTSNGNSNCLSDIATLCDSEASEWTLNVCTFNGLRSSGDCDVQSWPNVPEDTEHHVKVISVNIIIRKVSRSGLCRSWSILFF